MSRFVTLLLLMLVPASVNADTIRAARVLSSEEIEELPDKLEPRLTSISKAQHQSIEAALGQKSVISPRNILRELASKSLDRFPVMDLTMVFGDLPIAKEFKDHADPVVRFVANVYLLKAGQLDASQRLCELIDDESLDEFNARYLKTRFSAIGVDVQKATASEIAKHFSLLSREFPAISIGTEVPNAQFCDINERKFSLSDFRGKTVIVHYWATWCGPCMDELDSLAKRLDSLDKDKYTVLFVSLDVDSDSHAMRIEKLPKDFVFTCDGQSARGPLTSIFSVIHLPVNVVISSEGKLVSTKLSDVLPKDSPSKSP